VPIGSVCDCAYDRLYSGEKSAAEKEKGELDLVPFVPSRLKGKPRAQRMGTSTKETPRPPASVYKPVEKGTMRYLGDTWTHYESSWGFSMLEPVRLFLSISDLARAN
jgi:hypothetical protein